MQYVSYVLLDLICWCLTVTWILNSYYIFFLCNTFGFVLRQWWPLKNDFGYLIFLLYGSDYMDLLCFLNSVVELTDETLWTGSFYFYVMNYRLNFFSGFRTLWLSNIFLNGFLLLKEFGPFHLCWWICEFDFVCRNSLS